MHPAAQSILTAASYKTQGGEQDHTGDVVLTGKGVSEIWYHFNVDGGNFTVVSIWSVVGAHLLCQSLQR